MSGAKLQLLKIVRVVDLEQKNLRVFCFHVIVSLFLRILNVV